MFMRSFVGTLAVGAALGSSGCAIDDDRRVESFVVEDEVSALVIDVGSGEVTVRGSDGAATAVVARIRGDHCELDRELSGGKLTLASDRTGKPLPWRRCEIDLEVTVPANSTLALDTGSGDVTVAHLDGAVDLDTGSGDVALVDVTGALRLETGSGDVDARELASASAYLHAGSGDVTATFIVPPDAVSVDTGSGDVLLRLPAEHYRLDTDHGSGDVHVTGIVNDPSAPRWIGIDTGSGDIDVKGF